MSPYMSKEPTPLWLIKAASELVALLKVFEPGCANGVDGTLAHKGEGCEKN